MGAGSAASGELRYIFGVVRTTLSDWADNSRRDDQLQRCRLGFAIHGKPKFSIVLI